MRMLVQHQRADEATRFLDRLGPIPDKPLDPFTYSMIFKSLGKRHQAEKIWSLYQTLHEADVPMNAWLYGAVCSAFSSCRKHNRVLEAFQHMVSKGIQPNAFVNKMYVQALERSRVPCVEH